MKKWLCIICGWIYDEAKGWPADGIAPGTKWQDIPDDWVCPDCGVAKADFEMLEIVDEIAVVATAEIVKEAPIVIVGSGYAGLGLAEGIRQRSPDIDIVIFTSDGGNNYSKPGLSNALIREKSPKELVSETALEIEKRLNIRLYPRSNVQSIEADKHQLITDIGVQKYSKLILAQGSEPIKLPLQGHTKAQILAAKEVLSVNNLEDYQYFRHKLENDSGDLSSVNSPGTAKHVTIIGNGLIGCEFANDLSTKGYAVTVVGFGNWPMDRLIPREIGQALVEKLADNGVDWHFDTTVDSISVNPCLVDVDQKKKKYQLTLTNGETFESDLVLSAIGLKPRTALAKTGGVKCNLGIVVNGGLRTNVADIYAIGDCAEINGTLLPFIAPINFGIPALANCLIGKPTMAHYPVMPVIVKTSVLPITLVSPTIIPAISESQWVIERSANGIRALLLNANKQVISFALAGEVTAERQQWVDKITDRTVIGEN
jgi:rubredoxin-NAD+ reductase